MALKNNPYILFAILYLMISSCSQNPSSPKQAGSSATVKVEKAARLILQQPGPDTLKGSLKAEAEGKLGSTNIKIIYHSPAVRGRVVWGGLVPYNQVWVTGAHSATSLQTDQELVIGGTKLPAGKYALFTIPGKEEWIVIINKNWQQHLADNYSVNEDLVRVKLQPEVQQENQERLRYQILPESANDGTIVFSWEKIKVSLPVNQ